MPIVIKLAVQIRYEILEDDDGSEKIVVDLQAKVIHVISGEILRLPDKLDKPKEK